jgi:peptide deformylase
MVREILKLGNPLLYEINKEITEADIDYLPAWITDLHDTLMNFRKIYGVGRAIAAPQIGVQKRLFYMFTDKPYAFINPVISFPDNDKYTLMDDCMSFPGLKVKVERYKRSDITYLNTEFLLQQMHFEGDYSELIQHEYDHLDGILATMRAIDNKSLFIEQMKLVPYFK